jgi:hypothetical protein
VPVWRNGNQANATLSLLTHQTLEDQ